VVIAVVAVILLMPESRSERRPTIDVAGVLLSSIGLTAVTYGTIEASQDGWVSATVLGCIAAGLVALAVFIAWEFAVARRGKQSLIDLSLFRSAGFTWGTALSTLVSFAMFGIFFIMPQYWLDVRGLDSLASGVRMLSLIGGLILGLGGGQRLQTVRKTPQGPGQPLVSAKIIGGAGFAVMAVAMVLGTNTTATTSTGFIMAWFALAGLGLGLAMPTMLNAALSALTPERSGTGSALMSAMRQVGATIGVAVLGTVIATIYQNRLHLPGLPASVTAVARSSVTAGVAVAQHAPAAISAGLLGAVHAAYTSGIDAMLWICAGIAIAAAILAFLFIPANATGPAPIAADGDTEAHDATGVDAEAGPEAAGVSGIAGSSGRAQ
jgi:MFS transporter, DHA2 family, multidrug resistance protein